MFLQFNEINIYTFWAFLVAADQEIQIKTNYLSLL